MKKRKTLKILTVGVCIILFGALSYSSFLYYGLYKSERDMRIAEIPGRLTLVLNAVWSYGVIESLDPGSHTMTVRLTRFRGQNTPMLVRMHVTSDTTLLAQNIIREGAVATGFQEAISVPFSSLSVGMYIAGVIQRDAQTGEFAAYTLFVSRQPVL